MMVDLRGFGGSNGCLDWSGPGEQADVVNAVKWAASRPWSTGRVGMYGKSYDALTGLIGVDKLPAGPRCGRLPGAGLRRLPLPLRRRHAPRELHGDARALRRDRGDAGAAHRRSELQLNALNDPACLAQNWAAQAGDDNHDSAFWKLRNLIPGATGSNVPLFVTQGLTENNTVADGLQEYLTNHTGYERGWLGPWEHVRGNERCATATAPPVATTPTSAA